MKIFGNPQSQIFYLKAESQVLLFHLQSTAELEKQAMQPIFILVDVLLNSGSVADLPLSYGRHLQMHRQQWIRLRQEGRQVSIVKLSLIQSRGYLGAPVQSPLTQRRYYATFLNASSPLVYQFCTEDTAGTK